jgi:hypothetical protein
MAPMPNVDAPSLTTRLVFIGAFLSAMSANAFLLIAELFSSTDAEGNSAVVSVVNLLAQDSMQGGWVGLVLALVLLGPAYLSLMCAVGMWQRRERMQVAGLGAAGVLVVLLLSAWKWSRDEEADGNSWEIGVGIYGAAISILALLMLWRAGMWLLDDPYRE